MTEFLVYLLVLVLIGLAAFWLYANDKMRAKNELWRIPEAWLLAIGFFGGAIGALAAMYVFRHKTKHWYFRIGFPVILCVQVVMGILRNIFR